MKSKLRISMTAILLSTIFVGCSAPAINNPTNAPVSLIANTPTLVQVDDAVKNGLIHRHWIPQKVSPNSYIGTYESRGLMAKVKVTFNTSTFSIEHLESKNLDYDPSDQTIHPTYNKWIDGLEREIRVRVDKNVKIGKRHQRRRERTKKKLNNSTYTATGSFSTIQRGMSSSEVRSILGEPNDITRKVTKKAFNPFYFGSDRFRSTYYYKGQGRIEFNIYNKVEEIHIDRNESGNK